jgi:hypothetical protein
MNDTAYCNCMPRKDVFEQSRERNSLQRIAIWAKGRLARIGPFALRVLNAGTYEHYLSVRNPMDIENRLDAARTEALMLSIGMPLNNTRWGL